MTGAELKAARDRLQMSQAQLAEALGLAPASGPRSVRAMEVGMREVSGPVSKIVGYLLRGCHVPDGWILVPQKPTQVIVMACNQAIEDEDGYSIPDEIYHAMLCAAPPVARIIR